MEEADSKWLNGLMDLAEAKHRVFCAKRGIAWSDERRAYARYKSVWFYRSLSVEGLSVASGIDPKTIRKAFWVLKEKGLLKEEVDFRVLVPSGKVWFTRSGVVLFEELVLRQEHRNRKVRLA